MSPTALLELGPTRLTEGTDADTVQFIGDLDELVESTMCSCNAGDDAPY
ncbi:hypothetical protein Lfu02_40670 [Longispora fulva]|uniref:Uncharacterized protein n=1 Tax=Longispora fulva TaxID=619741 RepID=A0A8J7GER1_9ACTN|nr:hypothetical protein [Longispora fulva]MBG6136525.1 hypothetical protein [Longispora fulva]GIG59695.1 hypothetical protein Lfu02_40670 [Longispora fulva]